MTVEDATKIPHPDYLSKQFFETALASGLKSSKITVTDVKLSMGSQVGDNYCSEIYRANVTFTGAGVPNRPQTISLIIKAIPYDDVRGPTMKEMNVCGKEIDIYSKVLPKLSMLLNGELLGAKFYYATDQPINLLVFQDLKSIGYTMAERQVGLDEAHCRLVLEKIGKMHAASVALAEKEPTSMDEYNYGMFRESTQDSPIVDAILGESLSYFIEVATTWPEFQSILETLRKLRVDVIRKLRKYCDTTPTSVKVLNHGDMWVNNFMFKYDDGKPVDVVFIDYQMSFYTSPGIDLNYFMCTSPQFEVREELRDELFDLYIKVFLNTLSQLSCKTFPTFERMRREIASREFYGFFAAFAILPLVLLDKEASKNSSIEALADQEVAAKLRKLMYTQPSYQKAAKALLTRFQKLKVFENIE